MNRIYPLSIEGSVLPRNDTMIRMFGYGIRMSIFENDCRTSEVKRKGGVRGELVVFGGAQEGKKEGALAVLSFGTEILLTGFSLDFILCRLKQKPIAVRGLP